MLTSHRNKVVAVVAALVVVVGAGAAIGATGALSPKQESEAIVNDAAEELGVEPSELTAALKTGAQEPGRRRRRRRAPDARPRARR